MNRARVLFAAAMLAILALAAAFRLPRLAQRPMHADEANQAVKAGRLYETGKYEYDTTDHHGPSLYWLTLPSLAFSGAKDLAGSREVAYRIVPVIFGLGLIPLALALGRRAGPARGGHGGVADGHFAGDGVLQPLLHPGNAPGVLHAGRAGVRVAIPSHPPPGLDPCRRGRGRHDARHERDVDPFRGRGRRRRRIDLGLVQAARCECASAHVPELAEGRESGETTPSRKLRDVPARARGNRCSPATPLSHPRRSSTACLVAAAFFSMFGRNWEGPWKSICAYANYFRRGSQQGEHSEPWYYYLQILFAYRPSKRIFWSEGFIAVLALIGGIDALARRGEGNGEVRTALSQRPPRLRVPVVLAIPPLPCSAS